MFWFVPGYKSSSLNKVSLKKYQKLDATPKMFHRVYLDCFCLFCRLNTNENYNALPLAAPRVWNSLSGELGTDYDSLRTFKNNLKTFLYSIAGTLPSQRHAAPQITVFHLNLGLYKFHYLLIYMDVSFYIYVTFCICIYIIIISVKKCQKLEFYVCVAVFKVLAALFN